MKKISKREINWLIRDKYHGIKNPDIKNDLARLNKNEPIDYVIGWKPFLNTKIDLRQKPLIPRTETEYWVEKFINHINNKTYEHSNKKSIKILDIFAGSGCIGIAVLKNCPWLTVHFAEIKKSFLKQIKINLKLNKITKNFKLIKSDFFTNINDKYDYILANPPYVPVGTKLPESVSQYESLGAIYARDQGMQYIKKILLTTFKYLDKNGTIWLEFDSSQKEKIAQQCQGKFKYKFFYDQYKKLRYVILKAL